VTAIPAILEARRQAEPEARPLARRRSARELRKSRWESWRDWAAITLVTHSVLLSICLLQLHGWLLALASIPLAACLAVGTLTVLHDAGHRMFGRRAWPNVLAVQTATPLGLWAGHWGRKHRVHHKVSQVYPRDEATRASGMVRLHPSAPRHRVHRWQHLYIWPLYGITWMGEIRSQLTFLRTGEVVGDEVMGRWDRTTSFVSEKLLCAAVLTPYVLLLGAARMALLIVLAMTWTSILVALVLVVGHINEGLQPSSALPGRGWSAHVMRTTASFSTSNALVRWLTGGMTHHHVHHLRPLAPRSQFPYLHATLVRDVSSATGVAVSEYSTFAAAVAGHYRRLRELGRDDMTSFQPFFVDVDVMTSMQ
jgi:linoleoyl-CoA desaturase